MILQVLAPMITEKSCHRRKLNNLNIMSNKQKNEVKMKRVTGIGGIFFKSKDPDKIKSWYEKHLGVSPESDGYVSFKWREKDDPDTVGYTVWNPFSHTTKYFEPSSSSFMVNFRVENLEWLLEQLKNEGVRIEGKVEEYDFGRFAWVMDPEGNKIELWEPIPD